MFKFGRKIAFFHKIYAYSFRSIYNFPLTLFFYKLKQKKKAMKNTVFLDIDGVLQPGGWQKRFEINRTELQEKLTLTLKENYTSLDQYDVAAVYCDWDKEAIELLKKLLIQFEARIIISSSWRRSHSLKHLRMLFKIHTLDSFVEGSIPMPDTDRPERIQEFIDNDPNMGRFVIFDDDCFFLRKHFPNQLVCCPNRLGIEEYQQAIKIFEQIDTHP
jgi:hypothetical protein